MAIPAAVTSQADGKKVVTTSKDHGAKIASSPAQAQQPLRESAHRRSAQLNSRGQRTIRVLAQPVGPQDQPKRSEGVRLPAPTAGPQKQLQSFAPATIRGTSGDDKAWPDIDSALARVRQEREDYTVRVQDKNLVQQGMDCVRATVWGDPDDWVKDLRQTEEALVALKQHGGTDMSAQLLDIRRRHDAESARVRQAQQVNAQMGEVFCSVVKGVALTAAGAAVVASGGTLLAAGCTAVAAAGAFDGITVICAQIAGDEGDSEFGPRLNVNGSFVGVGLQMLGGERIGPDQWRAAACGTLADFAGGYFGARSIVSAHQAQALLGPGASAWQKGLAVGQTQWGNTLRQTGVQDVGLGSAQILCGEGSAQDKQQALTQHLLYTGKHVGTRLAFSALSAGVGSQIQLRSTSREVGANLVLDISANYAQALADKAIDGQGGLTAQESLRVALEASGAITTMASRTPAAAPDAAAQRPPTHPTAQPVVAKAVTPTHSAPAPERAGGSSIADEVVRIFRAGEDLNAEPIIDGRGNYAYASTMDPSEAYRIDLDAVPLYRKESQEVLQPNRVIRLSASALQPDFGDYPSPRVRDQASAGIVDQLSQIFDRSRHANGRSFLVQAVDPQGNAVGIDSIDDWGLSSIHNWYGLNDERSIFVPGGSTVAINATTKRLRETISQQMDCGATDFIVVGGDDYDAFPTRSRRDRVAAIMANDSIPAELKLRHLYEQGLTSVALQQFGPDPFKGSDLSQLGDPVRTDRIAGFSLDGVDLSNTEISLVFAPAVNWSGANLKNARFTSDGYSINEIIRFENVDMSGADLRGAQLTGAMFTNVNLTDVRFDEANLQAANFHLCIMDGVSFRNSNLISAVFNSVNTSTAPVFFSGADLRSAEFHRSKFKNAEIIGCNLSRFDAFHCDFSGANFTNSVFKDYSLVSTDMTGVNLSGVSFEDTNFFFFVRLDQANAQLLENQNVDTSFAIVGNRFLTSDLAGRDFSKMNLADVNMSNMDLKNTNFKSANLSRANLRGSDLTKANLSFTDVQDADLRDVDLSFSNLCLTRLRGADLSGAKLALADLRLAQFKGAQLSWYQQLLIIAKGGDLS
jgi:uncharacterized protein YjbI with pentapeptide repeats